VSRGKRSLSSWYCFGYQLSIDRRASHYAKLCSIALARSCIEALSNSRLCPALPCIEFAAFRFAEIKDCLTLRSMLRDAGGSIGPLRRRRWVEHITQTRCGIGRLERCAISLNAVGAEEGVRPMCAVDVGTIGDWNLRKGSRCDCR
jgi:hypothetical protein